jgi:hypothetical protein
VDRSVLFMENYISKQKLESYSMLIGGYKPSVVGTFDNTKPFSVRRVKCVMKESLLLSLGNN